MSNRNNYLGGLVLGTAAAIVGCTSPEMAALPGKVEELEKLTRKQATKITQLETDNQTLLGFYNTYRARLDTTPENLANHEYEEGLRYAAIRVELLMLRRQITDETRLRTAGDIAAIDTSTKYAEKRLTELERALRAYTDAETAARTTADTQAAGTTGIAIERLGTTTTDLNTRLARAEAALIDLQRADERRALDRASQERRK